MTFSEIDVVFKKIALIDNPLVVDRLVQEITDSDVQSFFTKKILQYRPVRFHNLKKTYLFACMSACLPPIQFYKHPASRKTIFSSILPEIQIFLQKKFWRETQLFRETTLLGNSIIMRTFLANSKNFFSIPRSHGHKCSLTGITLLIPPMFDLLHFCICIQLLLTKF